MSCNASSGDIPSSTASPSSSRAARTSYGGASGPAPPRHSPYRALLTGSAASVEDAVVDGLLGQPAQQVQPFESELDTGGGKAGGVDVVDPDRREQLRQTLDRPAVRREPGGGHELAGLDDRAVREALHERVEVDAAEPVPE